MSKPVKLHLPSSAAVSAAVVLARRSRQPASTPAVAGFRPAGMALALAAAFIGTGQALAQPTGA